MKTHLLTIINIVQVYLAITSKAPFKQLYGQQNTKRTSCNTILIAIC